ncbi:MAG TPA: hypothetical protein ACFYEK_11170 [Candidatus Wunengus sp. YC60]|uniref:hypothetical protein n=1 Tax=Candidatus Wunengus sp. YC60 TaxID=3367697 RepID=UPI00402A5BDF
MPVVKPSIVVDFIDEAYPFAKENKNEEIGCQNAPTIAAIIGLVEKIPNEHFSFISSEEFAFYIAAIEALKNSILRWQISTYDYLQHKLSGLNCLKGRHPLSVICETLSKCPDEAPSMQSNNLDFLNNDTEFKFSLRLDVSNSHASHSNGQFKASCVLAGSVIEALLLWGLKKNNISDFQPLFDSGAAGRLNESKFKPKIQDIDKWNLEKLINISREANLISEGLANALSQAQYFRNLIHPGRQERLGQKPSRGTSLLSLGGMERLIEEFENLHANGKL